MYSKIFAAALVPIVLEIVHLSGVQITDAKVDQLVTATVTLISTLVILWERYKKGGVHWTGVKKEEDESI